MTVNETIPPSVHFIIALIHSQLLLFTQNVKKAINRKMLFSCLENVEIYIFFYSNSTRVRKTKGLMTD